MAGVMRKRALMNWYFTISLHQAMGVSSTRAGWNVASDWYLTFCVAGGIKSAEDAARILEFGADKVSINSCGIGFNPQLITDLADKFGVQCIVVGIDSYFDKETGKYQVYQFTGDEARTSKWETKDWVQEYGNGAVKLCWTWWTKMVFVTVTISSNST